MWKALFISAASRAITRGHMEVHLPDGQVLDLGDGTGEKITIRIADEGLFRRFVLSPELAIGEAWMEGTLTVDDDDLYGFMALSIANIPLGQGMGAERLTAPLMRRIRQLNPIGRARKNVAHHYDLSGALYDLFLDDDRQYSCGYFRSPDDTLEAAQAAKKAHIARKLCLSPGMKVLDIGCGWGGMALTLAQDFGVDVVGVTLSQEQHKIARERVAAAGLQDRIDIRLTDYRSLDERFDRIVSVGMFEHVGVPHYREYFSRLRAMLPPDGVALIHTIGRQGPPARTSPWVNKYIFPGGYVPAMSEALSAIEKEGLMTTDVEVWRMHYAMTLRHWHDRFMANIDAASAIYDDRFCRMWRYYLIASELSFRLHRQVVFQFQLSRRQDSVPLTRDYMYGAPQP